MEVGEFLARFGGRGMFGGAVWGGTRSWDGVRGWNYACELVDHGSLDVSFRMRQWDMRLWD